LLRNIKLEHVLLLCDNSRHVFLRRGSGAKGRQWPGLLCRRPPRAGVSCALPWSQPPRCSMGAALPKCGAKGFSTEPGDWYPARRAGGRAAAARLTGISGITGRPWYHRSRAPARCRAGAGPAQPPRWSIAVVTTTTMLHRRGQRACPRAPERGQVHHGHHPPREPMLTPEEPGLAPAPRAVPLSLADQRPEIVPRSSRRAVPGVTLRASRAGGEAPSGQGLVMRWQQRVAGDAENSARLTPIASR
jgi:hypothetical protein